ncbi:hypothetical protein, partial [Candidatus Bealeia paramacronuclearis]
MTETTTNAWPLPQTLTGADDTKNQATISGAQGVNFINESVLSPTTWVGPGNAYQAVSQSMAQWVQSAALFAQNTLSMTTATTAVFEKKIAEIVATEDPVESAPKVAALTSAMAAFLTAAQGTEAIAVSIGQDASAILNSFPPGPNSN